MARDESAGSCPASLQALIVKSNKAAGTLPDGLGDHSIWQGDAEDMLRALPAAPLFDLVVSSPPYNIGKSYEKKAALDDYLKWQDSTPPCGRP